MDRPAVSSAPSATPPALPSVPPTYQGDTIICVAPGPSLTLEDVTRANWSGRPIITVNDAYRYLPRAHVAFAADGRWWRDHQQAIRSIGMHYTLEHGAPAAVTRLIPNSDSTAVLSDLPTHLVTGGHSGYAAVNLAYLLGASRIVLLGYDMQPDPVTGVHHYGDLPGADVRHPRYELWLSRYRALREVLEQLGVELINATRATAIPPTAVPRRPLTHVLIPS